MLDSFDDDDFEKGIIEDIVRAESIIQRLRDLKDVSQEAFDLEIEDIKRVSRGKESKTQEYSNLTEMAADHILSAFEMELQTPAEAKKALTKERIELHRTIETDGDGSFMGGDPKIVSLDEIKEVWEGGVPYMRLRSEED